MDRHYLSVKRKGLAMIRKSIVLMFFFAISSVLFAAEPQNKAALELNENKTVAWKTASGNEVQIGPPVLLIKDWIQGKNKTAPLNIELTEKSLTQDSAVLNYSVALDKTNYGITGSYSISISRDKVTSLLLYNTKLSFDSPVRTDVTVHNNFKINNNSATEIMLPERDGILQTYNLKPGKKGAGRYELGAEATKGINCNEIGMPVVGLKLEKKNLAVSIDPYCGGFIQAQPTQKETSIMVSTTYNGTTVPVNSETRKIALEFVDRVNNSIRNPRSVNPILLSFYNTIPEIKPGPDWLHDIQLTYYDYLSDGSEGWYEGLQHLADRIPEAHRDNVAVCQHGWYDYFQHYAYDHKKGKMEENWTAFPGTRQIAMSIDEMHKRFRFAKKLGFHTLIYFADGTNSDSGFSEFNPDYVLRDSDGNSTQGWKGPDSQGRPVRMDPSVKGMRQWFKGYLKTLIEEFAKDLDGFVWDETFYIPVHTISYTQKTPAYADRAMLSFVSELT
ncbi:MAG: hypothetical protein KGY74_09885 [Candidatus Cloacimonetes bacterium]|nr:hypothetical protein [Candidatus Cloacimonadota bacterium]